MNMQELLLLWSSHAGLSALVWLILLTVVAYAARLPVHELIRSGSRALHGGSRLLAASLKQAAGKLAARNEEILLEHGRNAVEKVIEREFQRINDMVAKDLGSYPALHRKISDAVGRIEDDYRSATETPPAPPAWLAAVETVAAIPREHDNGVARILDDIQTTIENAHKETLEEYRKSTLKRHGLLKGMMSIWRTVDNTLGQMHHNISNLDERTRFVDQQMQRYQQIRHAESAAVRSLQSSALTQFFVAGLVLVIATLGGIINFQLIALPMSEMVGGTSQIGPMRTADVAALVIIMVEMAMGLFLLESLRITHLFAVFGSMDDKMRRRMIVITLSILAILASVEASLAYMRDLLALDREALNQSLAGGVVMQAEFRWIPSIGQMILGFILPFTLAFVAIPLESFVYSLRTLLGMLGVAMIRSLATLFRMLSTLFRAGGRFLISFYDTLIFLPLAIENTIKRRKQNLDSPAGYDDEIIEEVK